MSLVRGDIPLFKKHADQFNQHLILVGIDVNDDPSIFLHVGADVSNPADLLNGFNGFQCDSARCVSIVYCSTKGANFVY